MAEEENKIHGPTTEEKAAYFIFGRFQPPHIGHAHLINILYREAKENGADPYVFPTSTQDVIRNPLSIERKVVYMKKMFPPRLYPGLRIINTTTQDCKTIYKAIGHLKEAGYTSITLFVGQDRVANFTKQFIVPKFKEDFGEVSIFGVERPENEAETSASAAASAPIKMSATMVRGYATSGNNASFARATQIGNMTNVNIESMMSNVMNGLKEPKEKKEKKVRTKKGSSASAAAGAPNNMEGGTRKRKRKYRNVPSRRRRHH